MALLEARPLREGEKLKPTMLQNAQKILNEFLGFDQGGKKLLKILKGSQAIPIRGALGETTLGPKLREEEAERRGQLELF